MQGRSGSQEVKDPAGAVKTKPAEEADLPTCAADRFDSLPLHRLKPIKGRLRTLGEKRSRSSRPISALMSYA